MYMSKKVTFADTLDNPFAAQTCFHGYSFTLDFSLVPHLIKKNHFKPLKPFKPSRTVTALHSKQDVQIKWSLKNPKYIAINKYVEIATC